MSVLGLQKVPFDKSGRRIDVISCLAAANVDRIPKGADPALLPIEEPSEFILIINLGRTKAPSLPVPPASMARAAQIIE